MLRLSHRLLAAAAAVTLSLGLAGSAYAQYFGQNKVQYRRYDWTSISSDHFEVYFYGGLDSLAMRVLDLAEKTNVVLSQRMGHTLGRRVPIILYGSHNDFAQTNVTPEPIDAGTGGFTEALRNRVVLPFTGSYEDLRHVVVHELTHAFMFDLLYSGSAASLIARQSFFSVPLWFAEGMAEFYSLGIEPNAEMFLRDGIVEGYLPPLSVSGGYLVYKQGQSAVSFLAERFGEERIRDLLQRIRRTRSFDRAFQRSMGMTVEKFDEQWQNWLRKEYWPTVASKEDPERFARRLTSHRDDTSHLNTAPAVSPQGDRIAYFTDRKQYTEVYVMSALDGKVQRRLIRGERSVKFEQIPWSRTSLTWSPDGSRIALTAKSGGRDVLYVVDATSGEVLTRYKMPCESLSYPAWSPNGDTIVVVGVTGGRSDLWLLENASARVTRLTDDAYDEKEPAWHPRGGSIVFSSDRLAPVVLNPLRLEKGFGGYGLFTIDLGKLRVDRLLDTFGDDHAPAWSPDGRRLAFITDRGGTPNIHLFDVADSSFLQLTNVLGGVQSLSWSRQNDRLVFSSFNRGGFDVFAVKEPLSLDGTMARLRERSPESVFTMSQAALPAVERLAEPPRRGALAPGTVDSVTAAAESLRAGGPDSASVDGALAHTDTVRVADDLDLGAPPQSLDFTARPEESRRDTVRGIVSTTPLVERGGPFAVPDSVLAQSPSRYKVRLAPDYAVAGLYGASGFGLVGSTQFQFSDFLGDHSLILATDVFSNSIEETNALAFYNYLPRRWDLGGGLFHFKSYYASRFTTLGEVMPSSRLFSERSFGALVSAAYPFDRFRRLELTYSQMFVERTFFEEDAVGALREASTEFRSISAPSVGLIGDNTLFGYYGPVNGTRYNLTVTGSFPWTENALQYQTLSLDARRYWDLTRGYTFAGRFLGGVSTGKNAQSFQIGGFSTLRGYPDFAFSGEQVAIVNAELRFPFIQQFGLVGPLPIGIFNLRGALFTDFGLVVNPGQTIQLTHVVNGQRRLDTPLMGFGAGIRTGLYFMIMKLDVAWNTDLAETSRPRWYFSLGPEF